jgi:hypothetical protein
MCNDMWTLKASHGPQSGFQLRVVDRFYGSRFGGYLKTTNWMFSIVFFFHSHLPLDSDNNASDSKVCWTKVVSGEYVLSCYFMPVLLSLGFQVYYTSHCPNVEDTQARCSRLHPTPCAFAHRVPGFQSSHGGRAKLLRQGEPALPACAVPHLLGPFNSR